MTVAVEPMSDERAGRPAWATAWPAAALAVVTFALYFRTRTFGVIRYDDSLYLTQNWTVQRGLTWDGLKYAATAVVSSNWHPLTLLAEMGVAQLFGPEPGPFHLLNAVLHAANVGLVYLVVRSTTGRQWRAAAVAALWGLHPLRVESVAWISELKDVLCGFFFLLTVLAFVRYRRGGGPRWYAAVVLGMVLAVMSKPMAVTLPFVLLLMDYWPLGRTDGGPANKAWWGRRVAEQLPLFALSVGTAAMTVWTQSRTGATASLVRFPLSVRLANAAAACWGYLRTTVVPTNLCFFYPHPRMVGQPVPLGQWVLGLAVLVGVTAVAVRFARRRPWGLVGWLWFLGMLVPVIGLVQVGQAARADRYTYLPSIGLTIAVVWAASELAARARPVGPVLAGGATAVVSIALAWGTARQVATWRDDEALGVQALAAVPDNYLAMDSLSQVRIVSGDVAEAVRLGRMAVALTPDVQETHHALALALVADNQLRPALEEYRAAIRLDPHHPFIRDDCGRLLVRLGRDQDAIGQFKYALKLDPEMVAAHTDLGVMYATQGKYAEAITELRIALALNPRSPQAHGYLASALQATGDLTAAVDEYRLAMRYGDLRSETESNLVWLVAIDGRSTPVELGSVVTAAQDARDHAGPAEPFPAYAQSVLLFRLGRVDEAIAAANDARGRAVAARQPKLVDTIDRRLAAYHRGEVADPASTRPATTAAVTRPAATAPGR